MMGDYFVVFGDYEDDWIFCSYLIWMLRSNFEADKLTLNLSFMNFVKVEIKI